MAESVLILGIDPGSRNLGYGLVARQGNRITHVRSGTLQAREAHFVPRMCRLMTELDQIVAQHPIEAVAIETVFTAKNPHSALVLGQARGAILVGLARQGCAVHEYTPMQIKQATTGHGRADKQQVQRMVQMLLGLAQTPLALDTSDALAVAICHAQRGSWTAAPAGMTKTGASTLMNGASLPSLAPGKQP